MKLSRRHSALFLVLVCTLTVLAPQTLAETHTIAGYFAWRGEGTDWRDQMPRFPWLGERNSDREPIGYDQRDPAKIRQTLVWARQHGVKVIAPINNLQASSLDALDRVTEVVPQVSGMRWSLFLGNFIHPKPTFYDFGPEKTEQRNQVWTTFVRALTEDILTEGWFEQGSYFRLGGQGGRPVVLVFRGKHFVGDYASAVAAVRSYWEDRGEDIYLIGMTAHWNRYYESLTPDEIDRIKVFDAMTDWSMSAGSGDRHDLAAVAAHKRPRVQSYWANVPSLTVTGSDAYGPSHARQVDFVPGISCQYDKSRIIMPAPGDPDTRKWARSKSDFQQMVALARDYLDPDGVAGTDDKLVWMQTLNEWPEGTPCEPTEILPGYPHQHPDYQDNYGFEFLETIREMLYPGLRSEPRDAILITPGYDGIVTTTRPIFQWDSVRANPGVTEYSLRVLTSSGTVVYNASVGAVSSFALPTGVLVDNGSYTWQVRARNSFGWGPWSLTRRFTVDAQGGGSCPVPPGHGDYCNFCGPCAEGQGDCDLDSECLSGLICQEVPGTDRCVQPPSCSLPPGHGNYCLLNQCGPCGVGEGDCDTDAECAGGLVCVHQPGTDFCQLP